MTVTRRSFLALSGLTLVGCGGGSSPSTPTGISFVVDWPDRAQPLPRAAQSLRVTILQDNTVIAERLFVVGADEEATITGLPSGKLSVEARAFSTTLGEGDVLASATIPVTLRKGAVAPIELALTSVITQIQVDALPPNGDLWSVIATARNSLGQIVLTTPAQWSWSASPTTLGTLTPAGPQAVFMATGFGNIQLTASESESGKQGTVTLAITQGEPTTTGPTIDFDYTAAGTVLQVVRDSADRTLVLTADSLVGLSANGGVLWTRTLTPAVNPATARLVLAGSFVLVSSVVPSDTGPAECRVRSHRTDLGSLFWEQTLAYSGTFGVAANADTAFFPVDTVSGPRLNGVGLSSGSLRWQTNTGGLPLLADNSRAYAYDSATQRLYAVGLTVGDQKWELLLTDPPRFLGNTSTQLLFATDTQLRGVQSVNGATAWTMSSSVAKNAVQFNGNALLLPTGGTLLREVNGNPRWLNGLSASQWAFGSGDDVVTASAGTTALTLTALNGSDGTTRWSAIAPSDSVLTGGGAKAYLMSATRGAVYALDATTGGYLWRLAATPTRVIPSGTVAYVVSDSRVQCVR